MTSAKSLGEPGNTGRPMMLMTSTLFTLLNSVPTAHVTMTMTFSNRVSFTAAVFVVVYSANCRTV